MRGLYCKAVILLLSLYWFVAFYNMTAYLSEFNISNSVVFAVSWEGYIPIIINVFIVLFLIGLKKIRTDKISGLLFVIFIFQLIVNYINNNSYSGILNYIFEMSILALYPLLYLFSINFSINNNFKLSFEVKIFKILVISIFIVYWYYWNKTNLSLLRGEGYASLNNAYYLLFLLPMFLIFGKKDIVYVLLGLLVIVSSMKRGGTLAYGAAILFYLRNVYFNKFTAKNFLKFFFIFVTTIGVFILIDTYLDGTLVYCFRGI
jgi:hypothetical protein